MVAETPPIPTEGDALRKAPTGISGLDEITQGGLPAGRPALVCGGPGCGKTVLAMEFLVRGAVEYGEPGLFVSFEESADDLYANFRSFGFDLERLSASNQLLVSQIPLSRDDTFVSGAFSLDGLLVRLEQDIVRIGARRVALDTLEQLFSALSDTAVLRRELARLFRWLKQKGVTSIVTGERGASELTRHGLEEYVSDCVLLLDHRISQNVSKRRIRIVKFRGSSHGMDEYPFLIGRTGLSVVPITSVALDSEASTERISSGVADLDAMFPGGGFYRGNSILISGTAGTGKSTLAAAFADAACSRGGKCLYLAFEEPKEQIVRNMRSIGIDLAPWLEQGLLRIHALRPTLYGLEEHLTAALTEVELFRPAAVVLDPISNFVSIGEQLEVKSMLIRVLDGMRRAGCTVLLTNLTAGSGAAEETEAGVSSMVDTWIVLQHRLSGTRRRRRLYVVKSRGIDHSRDTRELDIAPGGVSLRDEPSDTARGKRHSDVTRGEE